MTYYWLYEFVFPVGFGLVAIICLSFALTGMCIRKPLVYSSMVPLFATLAFLLPMFLIALRHIMAPPYFSGFNIFYNSVLVFAYPIATYFLLISCTGFTILGLSPRRVREQIQEHAAELGSPRVIGFSGMAMSLVVPKKGGRAQLSAERLKSILKTAPPEKLKFRPIRFAPTLLLGLFMAWGSYWSWCEATQCSERVQAFSVFMSSLRG